MLHMRPRSKHLGWVQEDLLQIALIPPLRPQSGGAQQDLHLITLVPPPVAVQWGCLPMEVVCHLGLLLLWPQGILLGLRLLQYLSQSVKGYTAASA